MNTMKKLLLILLLVITTLHAVEDNKNTANSDDINISQILKHNFYKNKHVLFLKHISNKKFLRRFYYKNNYTPLWIEKFSLKKEKYNTLFQLIKNDLTLDKSGILIKKTEELQKELDSNLTKREILRAEAKLTSLYYDFLNHTIYGEIQWKSFSRKLSSLKRRRVNASWVRTKPQFKINELLLESDINATVISVTPQHFGYQNLLKALKKLYELKEKGGWEKLPYFKRLQLESTGEVIVELRKRLQASGDYIKCENNQTHSEENLTIAKNETNSSIEIKHIDPDAIFGECLDSAVKKFQKRHGLTVDGIVGAGTQHALNLSVDDKIKKVLLNIDRIKWLPRNSDKRYLVANLPEFELYYIEDEKVKKKIRIIIGDRKHPTPIFSEKISYVVLNPYWKVPEGIVRREIIPKMIKNKNYLRKQGIVAHRTWSEKSKIINLSNVYWEQYLWGDVKFPYRLMQPPGPKNALGKIKFKFPNRFAVYLHDTPTRHLFKKDVRAFSHGCVRVSEPKSLLETVASFNENINMTKANKILKGKRKVQYNIKNKLPIYLVYITAGLNDKDELEFRNDIYRYDKYQKRTIR